MALADRFFEEVRIGDTVDLITGPKEIIGTVTAFDMESISIRKKNGRIAVVDLSTITYYELESSEQDLSATSSIPVQSELPEQKNELNEPSAPEIPAEEQPEPEEAETAEPEETVTEEEQPEEPENAEPETEEQPEESDEPETPAEGNEPEEEPSEEPETPEEAEAEEVQPEESESAEAETEEHPEESDEPVTPVEENEPEEEPSDEPETSEEAETEETQPEAPENAEAETEEQPEESAEPEISAEEEQAAEEARRLEEEARKLEEEQRQEEARRLAEEQRQAEALKEFNNIVLPDTSFLDKYLAEQNPEEEPEAKETEDEAPEAEEAESAEAAAEEEQPESEPEEAKNAEPETEEVEEYVEPELTPEEKEALEEARRLAEEQRQAEALKEFNNIVLPDTSFLDKYLTKQNPEVEAEAEEAEGAEAEAEEEQPEPEQEAVSEENETEESPAEVLAGPPAEPKALSEEGLPELIEELVASEEHDELPAEPEDPESLKEFNDIVLPDTSFLERYLEEPNPEALTKAAVAEPSEPETEAQPEESAEPKSSAEETGAESDFEVDLFLKTPSKEKPETAEEQTEAPNEEVPAEEQPQEEEREVPEKPDPAEDAEEIIRRFNPEQLIRRNFDEEDALFEDIPAFSIDAIERAVTEPLELNTEAEESEAPSEAEEESEPAETENTEAEESAEETAEPEPEETQTESEPESVMEEESESEEPDNTEPEEPETEEQDEASEEAETEAAEEPEAQPESSDEEAEPETLEEESSDEEMASEEEPEEETAEESEETEREVTEDAEEEPEPSDEEAEQETSEEESSDEEVTSEEGSEEETAEESEETENEVEEEPAKEAGSEPDDEVDLFLKTPSKEEMNDAEEQQETSDEEAPAEEAEAESDDEVDLFLETPSEEELEEEGKQLREFAPKSSDKGESSAEQPISEKPASVYAAPSMFRGENTKPVMMFPEAYSDEEPSEEPFEPDEELDCTRFEKAVISGDIPAIAAMLDMPNKLMEEGISEADLKRSRKVLNSHTLRSGNDSYSIGCRLDQLQGNLHGLAEVFFRKALHDPKSEPNIEKALRHLQSYCIKDHDYVMYTELYDDYKERITFPTSSELLFHAMAYDTIRHNGPKMLEGIPIQFSSETDYMVMIRYLKNHPDAEWLYECMRARLLEDVHYTKASMQLLEYIRDHKPAEFEQERKQFFLHLKEERSLKELEALMAIGHPVPETEKVYGERNGALSEDEKTRDVMDVVAELLKDEPFGILRAKAYLNRTGNPLSLLDEAAAEMRKNAPADWNDAKESGDSLAVEFLKAVYEEIGMSETDIAALEAEPEKEAESSQTESEEAEPDTEEETETESDE